VAESPAAGFAAVFGYSVATEQVAEFERVYGPSGTWAAFFGPADGYLGTELLRDAERPGEYLVIDRWASAGAYDRFRDEHAGEYAERSAQAERLYRSERALGRFTALPRTW
jgi:heme-degrading monooxygenase HmoA